MLFVQHFDLHKQENIVKKGKEITDHTVCLCTNDCLVDEEKNNIPRAAWGISNYQLLEMQLFAKGMPGQLFSPLSHDHVAHSRKNPPPQQAAKSPGYSAGASRTSA